MNQPVLRLLIQERLAAGRLPYTHIQTSRGGPGHGEICDGCGEAVTPTQMLMHGVGEGGREVRFHAACFYLWTVERQRPGHEPGRLA